DRTADEADPSGQTGPARRSAGGPGPLGPGPQRPAGIVQRLGLGRSERGGLGQAETRPALPVGWRRPGQLRLLRSDHAGLAAGRGAAAALVAVAVPPVG